MKKSIHFLGNNSMTQRFAASNVNFNKNIICYNKKVMKKKIILVLSILVAIILLQTLPFKFSGAEESVALFSRLGVEPWGRYVTATLELIAGVLILIPATRFFGALIAAVVMLGAVLLHIFLLGVTGPALPLFLLALFALISSVYVMSQTCNKNKKIADDSSIQQSESPNGQQNESPNDINGVVENNGSQNRENSMGQEISNDRN
jgi:uncharacterized membrane protein YphA (DoxX/SURF4 family)